jgi:hypothetical protein
MASIRSLLSLVLLVTPAVVLPQARRAPGVGVYRQPAPRGGVEPGVNGDWFQTVPIDVVGARPATLRVVATGKAAATPRYPDDVVRPAAQP